MVDLVTEQNVLAVMNLRTGAILWRKLLADANLDQLRSDAGQLFTAQGTTISCWDMKHGSVVWEKEQSELTEEESALFKNDSNDQGRTDGEVRSEAYELEGNRYVAYVDRNKGAVNVVSEGDGPKGKPEQTFELASLFSEHGSPQKVFLSGYVSKQQGSIGFRVLLVGGDSSLSLLQQGEVVWLREEALASIKSTLTVESSGKTKILAMTSAGKLFAMDSEDGSILWTKYFAAEDSFLDMWVYKTATLAVLMKNSERKESMLFLFEVGNGNIVGTNTMPFTSGASVVKLHPSGSGYNGALLVNYEDQQAQVVAENDAALADVNLDSTYFYNVDNEANAVCGYGLSKQEDGKAGVLQLWSFVLSEQERIVGSASPNFFQKIYSRTKVLGDRSVLYKYVNPNIVFVAAEAVDQQDPKLSIYLIDTVTGRVVYRIAHKGAQGPVNAIFHENWVVYQYWSVRGNRYEVSVLELYEDEPLKHSQSIASHILEVMSNMNRTNVVSSYAPINVRVLGQSYIIGIGIKAMAVTTTSLGITANQVLVGTLSDQVYAIDKKLLDPRRPENPSKTDKEEGLIPYTEYIPLVPQRFVSYTHEILGLKQISCYPTTRESSVLMLAHGVDLFYTRLMPSKSFDTLEDDFTYSLLVTTILALFIATVVLYSMVQKDNLKRNWV